MWLHFAQEVHTIATPITVASIATERPRPAIFRCRTQIVDGWSGFRGDIPICKIFHRLIELYLKRLESRKIKLPSKVLHKIHIEINVHFMQDF